MEDIQSKLKKARTDKKYTQSFMAKKLGITQQAYQIIESGGKDIRISTLKKICNELGISADWVLGIGEEK